MGLALGCGSESVWGNRMGLALGCGSESVWGNRMGLALERGSESVWGNWMGVALECGSEPVRALVSASRLTPRSRRSQFQWWLADECMCG